jgi:hypothetical protein
MKPGDKFDVGWCDTGLVYGDFAFSIFKTFISKQNKFLFPNYFHRNKGVQIACQRQEIIDNWYTTSDSEWFLFLDSDIVLNLDAVEKLFTAADKDSAPIVTGVYFRVGTDKGRTLLPVVYRDDRELHPLPDTNSLVKVDYAGLGFCLIHKSVITKLKEKYGKLNLFNEYFGEDGSYIGEDVSFFDKVKSIGIQVYAHTGATVGHIKTMEINYEAYKQTIVSE